MMLFSPCAESQVYSTAWSSAKRAGLSDGAAKEAANSERKNHPNCDSFSVSLNHGVCVCAPTVAVCFKAKVDSELWAQGSLENPGLHC